MFDLQLFAEQSGVEDTAAAGQETAEETTEETTEATEERTEESASEETTEKTTGDNDQSAAETEPVEKAFAARLKEATTKERQKARDELIAEMYGESHGIHTYEDYQKALREQEEKEKFNELVKNNIPEDLAKEIMEGRKFREQLEAERKARELEEKQKAEFQDFLQTFPDTKPEDIPTDVWILNAAGVPLKYAYMEHSYKQLREKELKNKANEANAKTSTGGVTGQGEVPDGFISFDTFETNKSDRNWIMKNYNKIMESRKHW